ncbi:MAG TPA: hypothetical protein PLL90_04700 [Bacteroidales bacterium]|nr:hypothetical protein [Bacteroidales bacterium]
MRTRFHDKSSMPIAGLPALLGLLSKHGKEKKRVHFPYLPGYSAKTPGYEKTKQCPNNVE